MKSVCFISNKEAQTEYCKAVAAGYGFTRQGNWSHYLFARNQIEPSVLSECDSKCAATPRFYIWSFEGCTMASHTNTDRAIMTPTNDPLNWTILTRSISAEMEST